MRNMRDVASQYKTENRVMRYLEPQEKFRSRVLYEEMFPEDEKEFVDAYYQYKTLDNEILVLEEMGEIISMLHQNPYRFWMRGELVESCYLVAVATRPAYRHQGCMKRLIERTLFDLYGKKQPFIFLMPASEAIYRPFDFRFMGNEDGESWQNDTVESLQTQFDLFVWKDAMYEKRQIPDQEWESTPMMARSVDLQELLTRIGGSTPVPFSVVLEIRDPILQRNTGCYEWILEERVSSLRRLTEEEQKTCRVEATVDIAKLGAFVFGQESVQETFPESTEAVWEKLSRIQVLRNIYINETV